MVQKFKRKWVFVMLILIVVVTFNGGYFFVVMVWKNTMAQGKDKGKGNQYFFQPIPHKPKSTFLSAMVAGPME